MEIIKIEPRAGGVERACSLGMTSRLPDGTPLWLEDKVYRFTPAQAAVLSRAASGLLPILLEAAGRIAADDRLLRILGVPEDLRPWLRKSWEAREPGLYGRYDFCWDGAGEPLFYEYNGETSQCVIEYFSVQPDWFDDARRRGAIPPEAKCLGDFRGALLDAVRADIDPRDLFVATSDRGDWERFVNANVFRWCAEQAGAQAAWYPYDMLRVGADGSVETPFGDRIDVLFKMRAWEKIMHEPVGRAITMGGCRAIEPFWKTLLQNKLILAVAWEIAEGHPNLIETYLPDDPRCARFGGKYAEKPVYGKEGQNVRIVDGDAERAATGGQYGKHPTVRQAFKPLPKIEGRHPMVGVMMVSGRPEGILIREDESLITRWETPIVPSAIW
jgi:glutathionylspermidine synthase